MPPEQKNLITVNGIPGCLLTMFVAVGALGGFLYLAGLVIGAFR